MTRILLAATLTILAGCTGAATFDTGRLSTNTRSLNFATSAGGRDMHTQIIGNPFAIPDDLFANTVTTIFNERNTWTRSNFTTRPRPSAHTARAGLRLSYDGLHSARATATIYTM